MAITTNNITKIYQYFLKKDDEDVGELELTIILLISIILSFAILPISPDELLAICSAPPVNNADINKSIIVTRKKYYEKIYNINIIYFLMDQIQSDNLQTNYLIVPKPINNDKIGQEVDRQYFRLCVFFIFIFIIIILALKEYLDGIRFIQDLSIIEYLRNDVAE